MKQDKILSYLGLATKAGCVASGEFSTESAIKKGQAKIVILALDASDNTKKMFTNMCTYYKVPIYFYATKEEIGHAMGKQFRASVAITEDGLAKAVEKHMGTMKITE